MSRRMSVALTLDSVLARTKVVTRRRVESWTSLAPGDGLTLIEKGMGLPKGARQVVVAQVQVVDVAVVPLLPLHPAEVIREGLVKRYATEAHPGETSAAWFARFWLASHGYPPDADPCSVLVRRIEWRYLDD